MSAAPKGEIRRLPKAVQAALTAECAGKPIREQNLSASRKHDYQQWLEQRQALARAQALTTQSILELRPRSVAIFNS